MRLPITPNQVTYGSLVVGLLGSFFLYRAAFLGGASWNYAAAGLLLFASVILDCADGQIARAKGGGSRMGRILDGMVDLFVMLPAYAIPGFVLARHSGRIWILICASPHRHLRPHQVDLSRARAAQRGERHREHGRARSRAGGAACRGPVVRVHRDVAARPLSFRLES